jgi:hypothetical protein
MENTENTPDPLNLDELIRQCQEQKKKWRPPNPEAERPHTKKEWQQLMDDRIFKGHG